MGTDAPVCHGLAGAAATGTAAPQAPCLDYRSQSQTRVPHAVPKVYNRARVFRTGEVEVRTVLVNASSRPPVRAHGPRFTHGVSGRGRRLIRRGVEAYVRVNRCSPVLYTLTTQHDMDDDEFRAMLGKFLAWCRKYVPKAAASYACTIDLQARGVLHAHLVLMHKPPPRLWARMRNLWKVKYDNGPGSFDIEVIRKPRRVAAYVAKYVTRHYDDEGARIGRNGDEYRRLSFQGNAYRVSRGLRRLAEPVTELALAWTVGPALGAVNLRGCVLFFDSPEKAHAALSAALTPGPSVSWAA